MSHRPLATGLLAGTLLAGGLALSGGQVLAASITIACGDGGAADYCPVLARQWAEATGHEVAVVTTPNSSTEKLSLYQQLLGSQSGDIDVLMVDTVWPGLLAPHLVDLADYLPEDATEGFFPAMIDNNTVDGRLVALPWFTDAGLLYYRSDLLEQYGHAVPETWAELTEIAREIQNAERAAGNERMHGFVFQGRAYEGLTTNALEWIASHGGGTLVDAEGKVTVNNPRAVEAMSLAASWIGDIAPRGVRNYMEEEARGVFQSGNAVFMRNWPYAWALGQAEGTAIQGRFGAASLPRGSEGESVATLGGWSFAVSRYSAHPEAAADLVAYLTAEAKQKAHAIEFGMNPTREALYRDPEVLEAQPFIGELYATLVGGVPRPASVTGEHYARVSNAFFNRVHEVLSGDLAAEQALQQLEAELTRMGRRGW
ncbi:ABC transporter substrate-binding protein [Halomonas campisalis]|uniref:ABC transporter substrate-binding protein n=1 Tax=Billgrantia campisalis TaxID=74661 RepID=A0ABS9PC69_9GAMM|nr:ABC transporter substrate-binding protein [Halomonas campisalis]MCG6659358.1 ABC transporter substrate-binding protein [Halomonas campisalis]MDR5863960.1 ABC transporter substrate-binding protein [Halomonas campisalis]